MYSPEELEKKILEWEKNSERFMKDADGNFVMTKDGSRPKFKRLKKPVREPSEKELAYRARQKVRKDINLKTRRLKKEQARLYQKRLGLKRVKELALKLDGHIETSEKDRVVSESDLNLLPKDVKEQILDGDSDVAFKPHPGPQTDFLASSEFDVLYGGAAGGGKSYAMLVDPLRYIHEKDHKALILRKTLPELSELIDKSRELYALAAPKAKYKETKKTWHFPSGAQIQFGYCERDSDVYQYQGQQYTWIGFDELTHLATSFAWDYLRSRVRTTNPNITCYMRATTNPGGPGHAWVKKRYIDPAPANTAHKISVTLASGEVKHITRKFIPAKLSDNPSIAASGEYEALLLTLDPIQRKRLLEGDWNILEGAAFPEFDPNLHVIPPMDIPVNWERFKCIDYGYRAPSACLWVAIDPSDGTLVVYRELYQKGLVGESLAERMHDMEIEEVMPIGGVLDGASWSQHGKGAHGPTVGETLVKMGHKLRRADKARIPGKIQVHERLKLNEKTGRPRTQFFNTCTNIIRELTVIPVDPSNKEDVDTKAEDHAYDAFRYGVMSRPRVDDPVARMMRFRSQQFAPADNTFGY